MRLIDADAVVADLQKRFMDINSPVWSADNEVAGYAVIEYINKVPTVEPKRGRWEEHCEIVQGLSGCDGSASVVEYEKDFLMCSECTEIVEYASNFCPNCGAKMGGDEE